LGFSEPARTFSLVLLLVAACGGSPPQVTTPDAAHVDTAVASLHEGQVVDSVPCLRDDLPAQHIHVHLAIIDDGTGVAVPAGIGVGRPWGKEADGFIATGTCFAWLHTHDTTGVVHVVSPEQKAFTLGQLFAVWGQPLGPSAALNYSGRFTLLVNGKEFAADPSSVPLVNFSNIVLELGKPPAVAPPATYDFSSMRK
jgi:hypothetical protein